MKSVSETVTAKQAAKILKVALSYFYTLRRQGKVKAKKNKKGTRYIYLRATIEKLAQSRAKKASKRKGK